MKKINKKATKTSRVSSTKPNKAGKPKGMKSETIVIDETQAESPAKANAKAKVRLQFVGELAAGDRCANWGRRDVMELTGKRRRNDQLKYDEVEMRSWHMGGEIVNEWWVPEHYPVIVGDKALEDSIMAEFSRLSKIINGRGGVASKKSASVTEEVEVTDPETGEVTIEVRRKEKKPSTPKAGLDPATSCTPGTSAHAVGLILLRQKPGPKFDRSAAIAAAVKELKMEKGLASSWVSTLIKRKAPFALYAKAAA